MGAYEDVPILQEKTSGAGKAWANLAATAGVNLAEGLLARKKNIEDTLKAENERYTKLRRIDIEAEQLARTNSKAFGEKVNGSAEVQKQWRDRVTNANLQLSKYRRRLADKTLTMTDEELTIAQTEMAKYQKVMDSAEASMQNSNELFQVIEERTKLGDMPMQGKIDNLNPRNNNAFAALLILNGKGEKGSSVTLDEHDLNIYHFVSVEDGKEVKFKINVSEPNNLATVPDSDREVKAKFGQAFILDTGVVHPDYVYMSKDGVTPLKQRYFETSGNTANIVTSTPIKEKELMDQAADLSVPIFHGYTGEQKVSAMKTVMKDLFTKNKNGKYLSAALTDNQKELIKKYRLDEVKYPEEGEELDWSEDKLAAATQLFGRHYAYNMLGKARAAVSKSSVTIKNLPPEIKRTVIKVDDTYGLMELNKETNAQSWKEITATQYHQEVKAGTYKIEE